MAKILLLIIQFLCASFAYATVTAIPAPPSISANAYLLMDFSSGLVIVAKNIDDKVPPASLTKMMTAYVVADAIATGQLSLDEQVIISEKAWKMEGSRMFIEVNKSVSVNDLLHGVVIQSGNDASVALAEYVAGSEENFAHLMNQYAKNMGMQDTHFTNSTGLPDDQHYTTVRDLATLAVALIRDAPDLYALHSVKEFKFNNIVQQNRNKLLWHDANVDGIKTGHTKEAGFCLVASAKQGDMRLISVLMGVQNDNKRIIESQTLLRYGFRFYETQKIYNVNDSIISAKVWKGQEDTLALGVESDVYATFPRGGKSELSTKFYLPERSLAPIHLGEEQGYLQIIFAGNELKKAKLIALQSVDEGNMLVKILHNIRLFFQ